MIKGCRLTLEPTSHSQPSHLLHSSYLLHQSLISPISLRTVISMSLSTYSTLSSFELLYPEGAPATTMASSAEEVVSPLASIMASSAKEVVSPLASIMASSAEEVVSPLVPTTASSASSAEVVRPTPAELINSYNKLKSVQTLWAKESVQDDEEARRPSTSNPVLAALCGKEQTPITHSPLSAAGELLAIPLPPSQSQSSLVRHWIEELPSPTWRTPSPGPSPAPQIAKRNLPLKGEKVRFAPYTKMVSGGQPPKNWRCSQCGGRGHNVRTCKSARRSRLCSHCGSIEHSTEECTSAEVEPELPHLMKKAQELPRLTLLEKVALMRSAEWTPEVCGSCWRRNPGHREPDCPHREMCFKCRGTGPYGYLHKHVCKLWPGDEEVFMQEDADYEYWSRYE
jgi:hypothetical protein